jgi:predicted phage-related endonuclease
VNRDEWLEWRKGGITATEVADAANGTYGGAYEVVARKLGLLPPVEVTEVMQRGHRWQERIADAVHALTGFYVVGEETWCQHAEHDWIRATVDGFFAETAVAEMDEVLGVVEIKTRGLHVHPPRQRWEDQVQWQLLATGLPVGVIAEVAIDDDFDSFRSLTVHEVEADEWRQVELVEVGQMMLTHIEAGTLPEPGAGALDAVKAVHAQASEGEVDIADIADDVERLHKIKQAVKEVTDERDALEARIRDRIADATKGVCDGFTVSVSKPSQVLTDAAEAELVEAWPEFSVTRLDRTAFKKEHKDIYSARSEPLGPRRLTIKEHK